MKRSKKTAAVDTAAGRLSVSYWPAAEGLIEKVDPYRKQVADAVGPLAHEARQRGAKAAHDALERVTPVLDDAWERATPAVEAARSRVQGDLLPRLNHALADAAGHPVAQEAAKRGRATAAALRGEVEPVKPKGRKLRKVLGGLAIVAAVGGAVVAVKKYLDSRDAEWEAPAPSTYGGSNTPKRADTSPWATTTDSVSSSSTATSATSATASTSAATPAGSSTSSTSTPATPPSATPPAATPPAASRAKVDDEPASAKPASSSAAPAAAADGEDAVERKTYGAGSYVGSKPPKGFEIKGNERSMKYHTPDSPAYERTISDVWFNSTEAAENNGFSRAQR